MSNSIDATSFRRYIIIGGAGFIGSHFADRLLGDPGVESVTLYDNFSSGRTWHYEHHLGDSRLRVVKADVSNLSDLTNAMVNHDVAIHLASNPDIAKATTEPEVDFYQGTLLTNNVVESMRRAGVPRLLYASGSGVYGEIGSTEAYEDFGPLIPVSTYGASKLAGEALVASYCYMFGISARVFRFGNVVGPRQTHGVGFDFVRRLRSNPSELRILGDGKQSKSYVHVHDVVSAVLCANAHELSAFRAFNVATGDYITVSEIADLAVEILSIHPLPKYKFTGGDRGWKGDVPIVRLNTNRIQSLGWRCSRNCREALKESLISLSQDERTNHE